MTHLILYALAAVIGAALVFLGQYAKRLIRERRWAREQAERDAANAGRRFAPDGLLTMQPFSVYINSAKVGTATESDVVLDRRCSRLTVNILLTNKRSVGAYLKEAFVSGESLPQVAVGIVDDEILRFPDMTVSALHYSARYKNGESALVATLEGPTLHKPQELTVNDLALAYFGRDESQLTEAQRAGIEPS